MAAASDSPTPDYAHQPPVNGGVREWCGACGPAVRASCKGSLASSGIIKVHWECWSECNLGCPFCFRTRGPVLTGEAAVHLVRAVATGGARTIAFTGGDPTLRNDLVNLVTAAKTFGLRVEVHTNGHVVRPAVWRALLLADRVCLSLDGPTPGIHDGLRKTRGNYKRVLDLATRLRNRGKPITIRTLVSKQNASLITDMIPIVMSLDNCEQWTLLEFTPVGDGFDNQSLYYLDSDEFETIVASIKERVRGRVAIDVFRHEAKIGTYFQITPGGQVYGTTRRALVETGRHEVVGSILTDHLDELVQSVPLDRYRHSQRYALEVHPSSTRHLS